MVGEYFGCWASWLEVAKAFVGEDDGVCGGTDGVNSLEEGGQIGGRNGRDELKSGGRCGGGMHYGAFGDKLLDVGGTGTAVLGVGLKSAEGEW